MLSSRFRRFITGVVAVACLAVAAAARWRNRRRLPSGRKSCCR